jgi:hypothetical protein
MKNAITTFWVTNISNRNVSLSDLNLTIKAYSSVNLMDKKHYNYSIDQLKKSQESGSLFNKRRIISVRKVPPVLPEKENKHISDHLSQNRERSLFKINEKKYEELHVEEIVPDSPEMDEKTRKMQEDAEFASENCDLLDLDLQQIAIKK